MDLNRPLTRQMAVIVLKQRIALTLAEKRKIVMQRAHHLHAKYGGRYSFGACQKQAWKGIKLLEQLENLL